MAKDFATWHGVKQHIDTETKVPFFTEREIWWCSIGLNVGYEIYGKGRDFARPILVIKKYSRFSFLGIPMTSKLNKASSFTYPIECKGNESLLLFTQARTYDARRLCSRMDKLKQDAFMEIKQTYKDSF